MNDPYGVEIKIGDRVAYNYQGQVRLGTVVSLENRIIKPGMHNWPVAKIMVAEKTGVFTSKVTNPKNLVVLEPLITAIDEESFERGYAAGQDIALRDC